MAKPVVRIRAVELALALGLAVLICRAAQVQLVQGARHAATAARQRTAERVLKAPRGTIYDRGGVALAWSREVFHVQVDRDGLARFDGDAEIIAKQLGVSAADLRRQLRRRRWVYYHGTYSPLVVHPLRAMRGVDLQSEVVRFYPDPDLARPVLGHPEADGRPAGGIERVLDDILAGRPGSAVVLQDPLGREYVSPARLDAFPLSGHDVYLTLDVDLQEICQEALKSAIERFDALGGDVVALRPSTGEILAMASYRRSAASIDAVTGAFEPGSTAKVFAAAALLTHGLAAPDDSVWTENGRYELGRRVIEDDHPAGWLTLRQAIERSSNIGIVKAAAALPPESQYRTLRDFGLGSPTGIEFPTEASGILRRPEEWSGTTAASLAMGYEVAVSALQLAAAYAAIANDGVLLRPTLVAEVRDAGGRVVYRHAPEPVRRAVTPDVAAQLRQMLRGVVYEGGTGSTAALTTYEVAGKTGTARRAGPGGYVAGSHIANFASIFPADDPQLVMVVKLDDPKGTYARLTAAPVTRAVLEQVLAAENGALDRARLVRARPAASGDPAVGAGSVAYVFPWPPAAASTAPLRRVMPDVRGLPLRAAAGRLHEAGLRVRVEGWGAVDRTAPAPGTAVQAGTAVTIYGDKRRPGP